MIWASVPVLGLTLVGLIVVGIIVIIKDKK